MAQKGLLYKKWKKHFGQDGDVLVWQSPSTVMHPGLPAAEIADAIADDPEPGRSEWEAAFRADLETFIASAVVEECTMPGVVERPPVPGVAYRAFLDASAGSGQDSFTCAVGHDEREVFIVDALRAVKPPFDPLAVAAELAAFLKTYGVSVAQSDKFAGGWVVEAFQRHGDHVEQNAEPKSQSYLAALPHFMARKVELLDLRVLRAELVGLERRRRAGGRDVVDHPPCAHDDQANAVCGLIALLASTPASVEPMATGLADRAYTPIRWSDADPDPSFSAWLRARDGRWP